MNANGLIKRLFSTTSHRSVRLPIVLPGERVHLRGPPPDPTLSLPAAQTTSVTTENEDIENKISFRALPIPIFKYIKRQLDKREEWLETDPKNPNLRHSEIPLITLVDNPFLMHRVHVSVESPLRNQPPKIKYRRVFSPRRQALMVKSYGRLVLPPSPKNQLANPPLVEWLDGRWIQWFGEFEKPQRKGLYANRPVLFKGHIRERIKQARKDEIQARVDTMDERIARWKASKTVEVKSGRASVPF
ncbi:hypothetical protein BCR39DRAFT_586684 [Naematelia encephala]|uniref:Large ribosomal subunit protein mL59 domain-containing protein n=1 Tax=Naematelia encephala TaxID=71784 RepID=A0A1Y2BEK0_9TREE|nr:hypothetical protein BCR39DRAFT_586684 [Naematelia encephala]